MPTKKRTSIAKRKSANDAAFPIQFPLRCNADQLAAYHEIAKSDDRSTVSWMRKILDAAVEAARVGGQR